MTRGAAVFVLVASLAGGATGGLVATALVGRIAPLAGPAVTGAPAGDEVAAAAQAISPAVVTIINTQRGSESSGSGVIIDQARGHVVTSSHVIEQLRSTSPSADITIVLSDGRTLGATVLGNDPKTDIALLKVTGNLPGQAELATVAATVGARVIAIGTPGTQLTTSTLTNTVTVGVVSATGRRVPRADTRDVVLSDLIQTDASIGDGMSGGPLVLVATKQVIGLNALFIRGQMDLGFAVSAATVRRVVDEILAKETP